MSIIAGWMKPTSGTVAIEGITRISWVFQNPHGVGPRTALDHVALPLLAQGHRRVDAEARALALMDSVDLTSVAGRRFRQLSGGEAQRLMLARAIAAAPQLLLVDEPTAQLDPRTGASVNSALQAISANGAIIIVATHDPATRDACTDVLDLGNIGK
ncbi:ABC-type lipoprotein export system ATPase subunit [Arthrobacter sp. AZCC_0090]|nr:ABC-type lipoprotein export system ATPase subunit [Arthrobacter sp. AZCC_0090]